MFMHRWYSLGPKVHSILYATGYILCLDTYYGPVWQGFGSSENCSGSGSSGGAGVVLENVWQNGFIGCIEIVKGLNFLAKKSLNCPYIYFFLSLFPFSPLLFFLPPLLFIHSPSSPAP
jgi:hypothetical protein